MTTIGGCQVYNKAQFSSGMVDVLSFECTFLGFVGPRKSLVQVKTAINHTRSEYQSPAYSFHQLLVANMMNKCNIIKALVKNKNTLTNPATSSPPIVPCEVTEAIAIRESIDQSSPPCGISCPGWL